MLVIRLAKVVMVAALAAFAFLVTYDNLVDYGSNYQFVQHVLSMDTTFPDNTLRDRAITNPSLWRAAYATIIAAEGLTCLLLTVGAIALVARLGATADAFNRAKVWAVAGLTVGFGV
jgi:predicted small integral membrane protein